MTYTVYEIRVNGERVTNLNLSISGPEHAMEIAARVSAMTEQPDVVTVGRVVIDPSLTGGDRITTETVATFVDGEEVDPDDLEAAAEDLEPYYNPHFPED